MQKRIHDESHSCYKRVMEIAVVAILNIEIKILCIIS